MPCQLCRFTLRKIFQFPAAVFLPIVTLIFPPYKHLWQKLTGVLQLSVMTLMSGVRLRFSPFCYPRLKTINFMKQNTRAVENGASS